MLLQFISQHVSLESPLMIAFIGGGGKTSSIIRLAKELNETGKNVLISTTTKMYAIDSPFISQTVIRETIDSTLEFIKGIALLGRQLERVDKLIGHPPEVIDFLHDYAQGRWLLIEADGSRGRSLKGHRSDEPQMPQSVNLVIAMVGADIYGKTIDADHVHRPEVFCRLTGAQMGDVVSEQHIIKLLTHPEGYFKNTPTAAKRMIWINKALSSDAAWIERVRAELPWSVEVIPWGELLQP